MAFPFLTLMGVPWYWEFTAPSCRSSAVAVTASGALAEETNAYRGRQLKWTEPPDLRKPTEKYRLYVFKDGAAVEKEPYRLRNAAYMFGRDRGIVDIPADHPSLSAQHAVLCYRSVQNKATDDQGLPKLTRRLRPYIMDLESTNGTFVNGSRIPSARYYELNHKDILKFGTSTREYVLVREGALETTT